MAVAGVHKPWFGATLKEWIFTTDHKKIGVMYGMTSIIFFLIAGLSALGIRLELFQPGLQYVDEDHYNQLLTLTEFSCSSGGRWEYGVPLETSFFL
jgi:cytochrome c oxidase subunit 1